MGYSRPELAIVRIEGKGRGVVAMQRIASRRRNRNGPGRALSDKVQEG